MCCAFRNASLNSQQNIPTMNDRERPISVGELPHEHEDDHHSRPDPQSQANHRQSSDHEDPGHGARRIQVVENRESKLPIFLRHHRRAIDHPRIGEKHRPMRPEVDQVQQSHDGKSDPQQGINSGVDSTEPPILKATPSRAQFFSERAHHFVAEVNG